MAEGRTVREQEKAMILPDHQIRRLARKADLIIPFDEDQLQPASYDVRIGSELRIPHFRDVRSIDLGDPETIIDRTDAIDLGSGYAIQPNRFVLAATEEVVSIPDTIVGRIEGKSSLARLGLQIHSAGYLDPGFVGNVTLELVNFFDMAVVIRPGILIAQLSFAWMSDRCEKPYQGRYQNADRVQGSRYHPQGRMPKDAE